MTAKKTLARICQHCDATFFIAPCQVKHGEGKFCSRACYNAHRKARVLSPEAFWTRVQKSDDCWLWVGALNEYGYGLMYGGQESSNVLAHRYSYELHQEAIPEGMHICHHCDNPPCVRPDHLFVGAPRDNVYDAQRKGRLPSGEDSHYAKLTEEQAIEALHLRAQGLQYKEIAERYGVHQATIGYLCCGKTWKHIPRP